MRKSFQILVLILMAMTATEQEAYDQVQREFHPWRYLQLKSGEWVEWFDAIYPWQSGFMQSQSGIRILRSNNQAGKTLTGGRDFVMFMLHDHPYWETPDRELRGRIVTDPTLISINIIPYLKKSLPEYRYRAYNKGKLFESYWEILDEDGKEIISIFDIMTYEQVPKEFSGIQLDKLWFDEPPPRAIWNESFMRFTATKRNIVVTMTPLLNAGYFVDDVVNNPGLDVDEIRVGIEDCPHITAQMRGEIEAAIHDPDERAARLYGEYMQLAGLVFKSYNEQKFLVPEQNYHILPDGGSAPVVCALDPHGAKHPFVVWIMTDQNGYPIVLDCLPEGRWDQEPNYQGAYKGVVAMIKQREVQYGYRVVRRMIDPRAGKTTVGNDTIIREKFRQAGMWFDTADYASMPETRNDWIRQCLEIDNNGIQKIRVSERARNVNLMFQKFQYDVKAMKANENKDRVVYVETWKDPADTLGYALSALPKFSTGLKPEKQVKPPDYFNERTQPSPWSGIQSF